MTDSRPSAPEVRSARGVLRTLREDLFTAPFAYRPLPPLGNVALLPWGRHLPAPLRGYARWAPHAVVGGIAALILCVSLAKAAGNVLGSTTQSLAVLAVCVLIALPVAGTLVRPLASYWASLLAVAVGVVMEGGPSAYGPPWALCATAAHLVVVAVVVLRTRPRLAPQMWVVTLAFLSVVSAVIVGSMFWLPPLAVTTGLVLVTAAALRAWRDERRQVEETTHVTARERSRRTLLEERATIARELHDVLAHHMSVIAIQAEAAPYRVQDTPPELATSLTTIRENAVAALTELRRILGVVRSDDPDAFGAAPEAPQPSLADLPSLLDGLRGAGLTVDTATTGAVRPLPQGLELSAYRIVQEALSNTLRHAPGAAARVELSYVLGGLGLRVVNGAPARPVDGTAPSGAGHGLLGMRERVQVLGGELTAEATDDGGYEVTAFLPTGATAAPDDDAAPTRTVPMSKGAVA